MKKIEISIHSIDDWQALYINGHLERENHSVELDEYFLGQEFPLTITKFEYVQHNGDAIDEHVRKHFFPSSLADFADIEKKAKVNQVKELELQIEKLKAQIGSLKGE